MEMFVSLMEKYSNLKKKDFNQNCLKNYLDDAFFLMTEREVTY